MATYWKYCILLLAVLPLCGGGLAACANAPESGDDDAGEPEDTFPPLDDDGDDDTVPDDDDAAADDDSVPPDDDADDDDGAPGGECVEFGPPTMAGNRWCLGTGSYAYDWVTPSQSTAVELNDDAYSAPYYIGFDFTFGGQTHDTFRVGSNGYITIGHAALELTNACPLEANGFATRIYGVGADLSPNSVDASPTRTPARRRTAACW
ncbi:MAG: hypothetical protein M5R36_11405 [Deltaproteobacteria bacterium]|nr:hypothetical protein [Deltaproteobacteria bacterium]